MGGLQANKQNTNFESQRQQHKVSWLLLHVGLVLEKQLHYVDSEAVSQDIRQVKKLDPLPTGQC